MAMKIMTKRLLALIFGSAALIWAKKSPSYTESIYSYSIITIDNDSISLSSFQGKRILFITLPTVINASNDSLLHSIDSLQTQNTNSLAVIAVPSLEDGYTISRKVELKNWYRSIMGTGVIITEGIYTRKFSGAPQHPVFQWLTNYQKNGVFDENVTGPRYKFLVWSNGILVAALGPQTSIGSSTMQDLLQE